jgi:hypothetical protein
MENRRPPARGGGEKSFVQKLNHQSLGLATAMLQRNRKARQAAVGVDSSHKPKTV